MNHTVVGSGIRLFGNDPKNYFYPEYGTYVHTFRTVLLRYMRIIDTTVPLCTDNG